MELTVRSLKQKDAGRGLAAIDRTAMAELDIENGDYVFIEGSEGEVAARVWPGYPEDEDLGVIRIDGHLRQAPGVSLGDTVTVSAADLPAATTLTVTVPETLRVDGDLAPIVKRKLKGRAVDPGQSVDISLGLGPGSSVPEQRIPVEVAGAEPTDGTVVVVGSTNLTVKERASERQRERAQSHGQGKQRKEGNGAASEADTETQGQPQSQSESSPPDVTYEDIGGVDDELEQVREMIELPMRYPELFQQLGIEPPKGVLLHGPPGTGKTMIAKAVANEIDAFFTDISGPEIMSRYYGESEEQLRSVFEEATEQSPAVVFIDEIDSIAPEREETSGDVERRIVAQLLSLLDGLEERGEVVVIGATNRVDAIDPALRRGGRFDREIEVGVPDKDGRREILDVHTRGMPISEDVDLEKYAADTHGFVGADIEQLAKEAAMRALRRVRPDLDLESDTIDAEVLEAIEVTEDDFQRAMSSVDPSALREVFVEVPDVSWDHVGGLEDTKRRLRETIQWPLEYGPVFDELHLTAANGVLLYGPPGTGKTLLAKAVASEAQSNFISIKGPELLNKYVGESEKGVREVFEKARSNAPAVIFFDEIDAIAAERSSGGDSSGVQERVVSQLLTELDGLEELEDVIVIATSNRPDLIDDALLRPGRFDRQIHVPIPDDQARREIFDVHTTHRSIGDEVELARLAGRTQGHVGADIEAVCREAAMEAARQFVDEKTPADIEDDVGTITVTADHFDHAIKATSPSVDDATKRHYEELERQFDGAP
ncbi:CDC48 family AAA ATPase [Halobiforma nitratireducens]|uniref:ATPase AAA n=1 Tax=Halobiforma nitratireducens JCM 10879 TaxID=1227454 RepID=M0LPV1_9EURY|nr:CDC48 family AAA ATPase [Halobiforma nitratireducens]EMA35148.1 ATPase AAA [Halobiforma nitratireducens JCM 10879]